jgi:hypothetical protein
MQRRQYQREEEERYAPRGSWREQARESERGEFGSPHDQGFSTGSEHFRSGGQHQRGYEKMSGGSWEQEREYRGEYRGFGGSEAYNEPYSRGEYERRDDRRRDYPQPEQRERRDSAESYREEPHYQRPVPEQYRPDQYRRDQNENDPRYRSRSEREERYQSRGEPERNYPEREWREPLYRREQRGLEEYYGGEQHFSYPGQPGYQQEPRYGRYSEDRPSERREVRGGYGPEPQYGYDQPRPDRRDPREFRERERQSWEGRSGGGDERREYEQWLAEHRGRDRTTEAERQLEGLNEQRRRGGETREGREQYEDERMQQPRSQRRQEERSESRPREAQNRATQVRPAARPAAKMSQERKSGTKENKRRG